MCRCVDGFIASYVVPTLPPLVLNGCFCNRLGLTRDGAPEMPIIIIIIIIIIHSGAGRQADTEI